MTTLEQLANLLEKRNRVDADISLLIGRPTIAGHLGEFIASIVFDIHLHESATFKASDGVFSTGTLAGKTVNIKHYSRMQPLLDISASIDPIDHADYYLVLTGPRENMASSRNTLYAWSIAAVYLFNASELITEQLQRKVKLGIASSVPNRLWNSAMIYPEQINHVMQLSDNQRKLLSLFAPLS